MLLLVFSLYFSSIFTQVKTDSIFAPSKIYFLDSSPTFNEKRFIPVAVTAGSIYLGSLIGFNKAWYADYPKSKFHFYNDNKEWMQMDKFGHFYGNYFQTQFVTDMFQWTGYSRKKSIIIGSICGIAYQSVIEVLDGYSSGWGFSWGDMTANALGDITAASQDYFWDEQRIQIKFSAHKENYQNLVLQRADTLFGKSLPSRILKDYNGQTYWFSINPWSFSKNSKFPKWINLSLGIGAQGMLGGYNNDIMTNQGINIKRYRQFYLSPDIDLTKINTHKRGLRLAFKLLNIIKIPLPTLEYNTNNELKFHGIYF